MTRRSSAIWMLAGMVSGMAILTRTTGLILIGVAGLVLLIRMIAEIRYGGRWRRWLGTSVGYGLIWLLSAGLTIFALLPALWVAPGATLTALWSWSSNAATEGHENPTFFRGIHTGNPGFSVYPTVILWRTSPAEWAGIILLAILIWWAWRRRCFADPRTIPTLVVTAIFATVYLIAMSLGAKKFDRYILPVFPVIVLLAAQGVSLGKTWLWEHSHRYGYWLGNALIAAVLATQIAAWNGARPYRLDYYSPILGGATSAQYVLQMGWGQGGDQVVDYLAEQEADGQITVQTSAVPSAFTYFLTDNSPIQFENFGLGTPAGWYETEYYIAGIQQTQRNLDPWYDLFTDQDPVKSVEIGGVSYFDIYAVRSAPLPAQLRTATACNYSFGSQITLMQIIGRDTTVDVYFLSEEGVSSDPVTLNILIASNDGSTLMQEVTFTPANPGTMNKVTINTIDGDLQTAQFTISATISGQTSEVTAPWLNTASTAATTQSECYYTEPPTS